MSERIADRLAELQATADKARIRLQAVVICEMAGQIDALVDRLDATDRRLDHWHDRLTRVEAALARIEDMLTTERPLPTRIHAEDYYHMTMHEGYAGEDLK
jgi:hypothetical protein